MDVIFSEGFREARTDAQTLELFESLFNLDGLNRRAQSFIYDVVFKNIVFSVNFYFVRIKEKKTQKLAWLKDQHV